MKPETQGRGARRTRSPPAQRRERGSAAARVADLLAKPKGGLQIRSTDGRVVDLPSDLASLLHTAADLVAAGKRASVLSPDDTITTTKAAAILKMSRQYLVRLLDRGDIPSTKAGTHRRVSLSDVLAYQRRRNEGRDAALAALAQAAQVDGGYDAPARLGPARSETP